jgi:dienelactone hydrolase
VRKIFGVFLAGLLLATISTKADNVRVIRLMTPDDLGLSAAYYPVETNSPAVILLHSFSKNRDEWIPIATMLQRNGIAALALDIRGHGDSSRRLTDTGPEPVEYHSLKPKDYKSMLLDINQVYDWLVAQPGIDQRRIGIIGAGFGANLALRYAVFNDEITALLLLSPGMVYQTVRADDVIVRYGKRPLHIAVSHDDGFGFESSKQLIEMRKQHGQALEENELTVCSGALHGVPMLLGVKGLNEDLFGWLQKALAAGSPDPK